MQIEGNNAKADDAIMLDKDGYVSETNATNIVRLLCALFSKSLKYGTFYLLFGLMYQLAANFRCHGKYKSYNFIL